MPRPVVASGLAGSEPFPAAAVQVAANVAVTAFTHRVTILRDSATGTDDGGQPVAAVWDDYLEVPCLGFVLPTPREQGKWAVDTSKTAMLEDRRVLVDLDTDVTFADQLGDVKDSDGQVVFAGPMVIRSMFRRPAYLELAVEEFA